ncbi:Uncharacterized protein OS=uncultured bacterium PE=4 SV=1 [Gemmata massiliana]|uniref:SMI1/KNR4 family protein n=1 Tax=Gemmata massiliana TaxID=1210884 RepID=A0A6P2CU44_9BACT|nr:hypothetical protein [Gemmata massiliana]VTR92077.1 Uncharacterized protein OS=uncultured bacterium PE=4 SV=1 [Gemmata massiliana]
MTEKKWLSEQKNPYGLLNHLGEKASKRKAQLFACAALRRCDPPLSLREEEILLIVERSADGRATDDEILFAAENANERGSRVGWAPLVEGYWEAVECARVAGEERDEVALCKLVREVFSNPFRPVAFDPSWLTSTVTQLAERIYQERSFDRMPILADALQDAGCNNEDVLNHCRRPGEHVRGCWVVDTILGKA